MRKSFIVLISCMIAWNLGAAQTLNIGLKKQWLQDTVTAQLQRFGISGTPAAMYVRSFKFEKQCEVWLKADENSAFKLFKTYKVCTQSGTMGPKRVEGDYQVPEGIYYINEYNPNSAYYLALGLNYPNASDRILSDPRRPGSAIYVHGNCVSTGCIPLTDAWMEEVYALASLVRNHGGQEFIPIHIFPVRYNVKKSAEFLENFTRSNEYLKEFNANLRQIFDYFEKNKQLPLVLVNSKGNYVIN